MCSLLMLHAPAICFSFYVSLRIFDICQEISFYGSRWGGGVRQNPLKKFEDPVQLKKVPTPLGSLPARVNLRQIV